MTDQITCYLNFADPASWLAIEPLHSLIETGGITLTCHPMIGSLGNVVASSKAGEVDPLAAYKARRARARSLASARENERMAERLGVEAEALTRDIDPRPQALGLMWLNQQAAGTDSYFSYLRSAFQSTFGEADSGVSVERVSTLIESAGVSTTGFSAFADSALARLAQEDDQLLEAGILYSPAFVVDGEIFHGREHLPLITWMLTGRKGAPPV